MAYGIKSMAYGRLAYTGSFAYLQEVCEEFNHYMSEIIGDSESNFVEVNFTEDDRNFNPVINFKIHSDGAEIQEIKSDIETHLINIIKNKKIKNVTGQLVYISFNKEKAFPEVKSLSVDIYDNKVSYLTDTYIDENDGTVASDHF
jgi:hypothetical protein